MGYNLLSDSSTTFGLLGTTFPCGSQSAGPTTLHLTYEAYLVLCMSILTGSSLVALYKYSFGTAGDWYLILGTSLWLGRFLLLRIVCTCNLTSSRNLLGSWRGIQIFGRHVAFNLRGIRRYAARFFTAGQYFDPPRAVSESDAAHFWCSYGAFFMFVFAVAFSWVYAFVIFVIDFAFDVKRSFSRGSEIRSSRDGAESSGVKRKSSRSDRNATKVSQVAMKREETHNIMAVSGSSELQAVPGGNSGASSASSAQFLRHSSRATEAVLRLLEKYWQYVPSAQLVAACLTGCLCFYGTLYLNSTIQQSAASSLTYEANGVRVNQLQNSNVAGYHRAGIQHNNHNLHAGSHERNAPALNHFIGGIAGSVADYTGTLAFNPKAMPIGPFGFEPPGMLLYLVGVAAWSTLASLIIYGRIILPIPDLMSGISPTLKTAKVDQRHYTAVSDGSIRASLDEVFDFYAFLLLALPA
jgi:hypothetical protein